MKSLIEVEEDLPGEWSWSIYTPGFPTMESHRPYSTEAKARAAAVDTAIQFGLEIEVESE